MNRIPYRALAYRMRKSGWPGLAGIGLLVVAALLYLAGALPLQEESERLRGRLTAMANAERPGAGGIRESQGETELWQAFPPLAAMEDSMASIYQAAAGTGVRLQHGTYSLARQEDGYFVLYRIDLPVRGEYARIREFIAAAMNQLPALALDDVAFKRESRDDPTVEAKLKFTLYMRAR